MRTLIIQENGQEVERVDGTFLAVFPSPSGVRVVAEVDFTPLTSTLKPILNRLLTLLLSVKP